MDTCTFLCSIGQWLETNLGCFDQALVALWFRSRVFVIFSNIDQVYGSGIEIVRQILQNRPWRINHADTYSRKLFLKGIQKFYFSILRRKKIYRNLYFVYYILYLLEVKDMKISVTYNFYQNWNKKRSLIDDWFWIPIYIYTCTCSTLFFNIFFRDTYSLNACIVFW